MLSCIGIQIRLKKQIKESRSRSNLKGTSKGIVEHMKYVEDQGFQGIGRYKPMVCTQYPTLIIAPGFDQYNTTLE